VIPDAKVRIYAKQKITSVPVALSQTASTTGVAPVSSVPAPTVALAPVVPPSILNNQNLIIGNTLLDLTNLQIPVLTPETKTKFTFFCPQIRKTIF